MIFVLFKSTLIADLGLTLKTKYLLLYIFMYPAHTINTNAYRITVLFFVIISLDILTLGRCWFLIKISISL